MQVNKTLEPTTIGNPNTSQKTSITSKSKTHPNKLLTLITNSNKINSIIPANSKTNSRQKNIDHKPNPNSKKSS